MIRSNCMRIDPTKKQTQDLRLLGDRVSRLYNAANYECRQAFLKKEGVPTGAELERRMKNTQEYKSLPSDIAQEVLKKLSEAWKSYWKLRKEWDKDAVKNQKPGLPSYRKDRKTNKRPTDWVPIKHSRSYNLDAKDVNIVLPKDLRKKHPQGRIHIAYRGHIRFNGEGGRAELQYDKVRKRWYFSYSVEVNNPPKVEEGKSAAIDLGVRILASLSIEGVAQALHLSGRDVMKDWDYLGNAIADEQSMLGTSRGKRTSQKDKDRPSHSRGLSLLFIKRKFRVRHAMKCVAKEVTEHCLQHGVSTVYLGWPKNILRDVKYRQPAWAERIHNFWAFNKTLGYLENALENVGIQAIRVGERGTSSECCYCQSKDVIRKPRHLLTCKACEKKIHSDQGGSRNMLKQNKPNVCWDGLEASPLTVTRRWTKHLWTNRSVNSKWGKYDIPEFLKVSA
jgi:putative transposase